MFNWNLVYICMSHANHIAMIWERSELMDVNWLRDIASLISMLQGPLAAPTLQHLTKEDLSKFYFGEFQMLDINGVHCFLTRTGYASFQFLFYSDNLSIFSLVLYWLQGLYVFLCWMRRWVKHDWVLFCTHPSWHHNKEFLSRA